MFIIIEIIAVKNNVKEPSCLDAPNTTNNKIGIIKSDKTYLSVIKLIGIETKLPNTVPKNRCLILWKESN